MKFIVFVLQLYRYHAQMMNQPCGTSISDDISLLNLVHPLSRQ